jgi:hypothetical protein
MLRDSYVKAGEQQRSTAAKGIDVAIQIGRLVLVDHGLEIFVSQWENEMKNGGVKYTNPGRMEYTITLPMSGVYKSGLRLIIPLSLEHGPVKGPYSIAIRPKDPVAAKDVLAAGEYIKQAIQEDITRMSQTPGYTSLFLHD